MKRLLELLRHLYLQWRFEASERERQRLLRRINQR